jgi:hypothetical protein
MQRHNCVSRPRPLDGGTNTRLGDALLAVVWSSGYSSSLNNVGTNPCGRGADDGVTGCGRLFMVQTEVQSPGYTEAGLTYEALGTAYEYGYVAFGAVGYV